MKIEDSEFKNCNFNEGILPIDINEGSSSSNIMIENTTFKNNTGYNGSILNINELDENSSILINDSMFDNNKALNYGGVLYSSSRLSDLYVFFNDCKFKNNKSVKGTIVIYHL